MLSALLAQVSVEYSTLTVSNKCTYSYQGSSERFQIYEHKVLTYSRAKFSDHGDVIVHKSASMTTVLVA